MISGHHQKLSYVRAIIKLVNNNKLEDLLYIFFLFARCAGHVVLALIESGKQKTNGSY